MCLCLSRSGVGGEWVGDWNQGLEGWCYVYMTGQVCLGVGS